MSRYKGLLPVVTFETLFLLAKEFEQNGGPGYINVILEKIAQENIVISEYINYVLSMDHYGKYNAGVCGSMYRLIHKEGQRNNKDYKLPTIKVETAQSVFRDMQKNNSAKDIINRLYEDNNIIFSYINAASEKLKTEHTNQSCTMIYRMLESQAEADKLERDLPKIDM